jgi:DNA-binding transcriptional LysR family regulator
MDLDFRKLVHALAVERHGSFTAAASELRLTQSALSRSIASLEERWSVQIFTRSRKAVQATQAGQAFLQEAARLVADAAALDHNMLQRNQARTGVLAFGLGPFVANMFMTDLLKHASRAFPDLKVLGTIKDPDALIADIAVGALEFAVYTDGGSTVDHDLARELLCAVPYSLMVGPGHPLLASPVDVHTDLSPYPFLTSSFVEFPGIATGPKIRCDHVGVSIDMLTRSDTIWFTSPWLVREELINAKLFELETLIPFADNLPTLSVFSAKARVRSAAATVVIKRLRRSLEMLLGESRSKFTRV